MDEYYVNQAGSGLAGFSGHRYQKGDGFFGRVLSGTVLPALKKVLPYLGQNLLSTAGDVFSDVTQGQKLKDSLKSRIKERGQKIGEDAMAKVRQLTGTGKRRRRTTKRKPPKQKKTKGRKGKRKSRKTQKAFDFL